MMERLEKWSDKYKNSLNLVRTILAICAVTMQIVIMYHLLHR